ncbi:heme peroxidase, partial [Coemansia sp. RSA 2049]
MPSLRIVPRTLSRAGLVRAPRTATISTGTVAPARAFSTRSNHRQQMPRTLKSGASPGVVGALVGGALVGWYLFSSNSGSDASSPDAWRKVNYHNVYKDIAALLEDENYDDGSYGPVFVRLAWHSSGT